MGAQSTARREGLAKRERRLAKLARKQHGVLSREQLLTAGLSRRTIARRVEARRLSRLHQGIYAFGYGEISRRGEWMAAVLACGDMALLSHRSAAALWGLARWHSGPVEVTAPAGRGRPGITVHEGGIAMGDRAVVDQIPVTSVARTLFDLAEALDEPGLRSVFEEADRLGLLQMRELEDVCARGHGRRALRSIRPLIDAAQAPKYTRSPLEGRFLTFCQEQGLPLPQANVTVLGREVDAYWPQQRLIVEADGWSFHGHRSAFERDRARNAAMLAQGYRVVRITHRRLEQEPEVLAAELHNLLRPGSGRATS